MSVIEEAPHDRHPVQTYVLEHDNAVINEAIRRELGARGQVYYLHNDVASIERRRAHPGADSGARVGFGHGKMAEHELSRSGGSSWSTKSMCWYAPPSSKPVWTCRTPTRSSSRTRTAWASLQRTSPRARGPRSRTARLCLFDVHAEQGASGDLPERLSAIREFTEFVRV